MKILKQGVSTTGADARDIIQGGVQPFPAQCTLVLDGTVVGFLLDVADEGKHGLITGY